MQILLILLSVFLVSCNVISLLGKETYLDEDTFRRMRKGPFCSSAADPVSAPFHQGDGSSGNPYIICTAEQLQDMDLYLNSHFQLDADLDLSRSGNFYPIGYCYNTTSCGSGSDQPFEGSFDGSNYYMYNLYISEYGATAIGLFGYVGSFATIQNFKLFDANINISSAPGSYELGVGGIVGRTANTGSPNIINVEFNGNLNFYGGANAVGGVVGYLKTGRIDRATSNARIYVNGGNTDWVRNIGGLVGNQSGNVTQSRSFSSINISSSNGSNTIFNIGGLSGSSPGYTTWKFINDSYSRSSINIQNPTGSVSAVGGLAGLSGFSIKRSYSDTYINVNTASNYQVGGLVGFLSGGNIRNSFAIASINAAGSGGIYGLAGSAIGGSVSDSFTNASTCYNTGGAGCIPGISAGNFKGNSSYSVFSAGSFPWDFSTIWSVRSNDYPSFQY